MRKRQKSNSVRADHKPVLKLTLLHREEGVVSQAGLCLEAEVTCHQSTFNSYLTSKKVNLTGKGITALQNRFKRGTVVNVKEMYGSGLKLTIPS